MQLDKERIISALKDAIIKTIILFISFSLSFNAYRLIKLIPSGSDQGVKTNTIFFPESNYIFILAVLFLTFILYIFLVKLRQKNRLFLRIFIIIALSFTMLFATIAPGFAKYKSNIDPFHNGEQLSPALAFNQGKKPYTQILTLRGAGEDIVTPWISFKLFGESIGSYFLITVLLQFITAIVFMVLIAVLFKDDLVYLLCSLWFISGPYNVFYNIRDIFVWISLILVYLIIKQHRLKNLLLCILGGIAALSIFYSFDRGIFINALLLITVLIVLLFKHKEGYYLFQPINLKGRVKLTVPILIGYLTIFTLVSLLLGFEGLRNFISTNLNLASFQGIIFNFPYPQANSGTLYFWLPIIAMIACIFTTVVLIGNNLRKGLISENYLFSLLMTILGIITFRAATGRPDTGHIAYGAPVIFLSLFYVLYLSLIYLRYSKFHENLDKVHGILVLLIVIFICFTPSIFNYLRIAEMSQVPFGALKTIVSGPSKPDTYWYTQDVNEVTNYIKSNAKMNDALFVFSSDPIYYYSTKLKNPTRFYISWFADPNIFEEEALADLQKAPPKFIIYESGSYYDRPEFISMKERLPAINDWILNNYPNSKKINNATILYR